MKIGWHVWEPATCWLTAGGRGRGHAPPGLMPVDPEVCPRKGFASRRHVSIRAPYIQEEPLPWVHAWGPRREECACRSACIVKACMQEPRPCMQCVCAALSHTQSSMLSRKINLDESRSGAIPPQSSGLFWWDIQPTEKNSTEKEINHSKRQ